jgi:hypothetical protein
MRELVDEQDGRPAREGRIEVELLLDDALVAHGDRRQPLESFEKSLRLDAAVGLDVACDEVRARGTRGPGRLEH